MRKPPADRFRTHRQRRSHRAGLSARKLRCEVLEPRTYLSATILSVTPNSRAISDNNVGSHNFSLAVAFSEAMDTAIIPTISFPASGEDPTAAPATLTLSSGSWNDSQTFVARYDVADQNLAMPHVDVRISGAKDAGGNTLADSTTADNFLIDTQNPTVVSVTPNLATVTDLNVGSQKLTLTVVFSEVMDTVLTPTISFPTAGEDPTAAPATLTFSSASWTDSTTYVAKYDVADHGLVMPNVDVRVSNARDSVDNLQVSSTTADRFSINTLNPPVVSVTPNLATMTDANVGSQAFTLTVVYGDAMNTSINPTIAFPASGKDPTASPATLTLNSGTWTNDTTYVAKYDVADQNVAMPAVDVQVSGARDTGDDVQAVFTAPGSFSIDTQNPTVVSVTPNLATVADANVGSQTFTLSVVFSEAMNTAVKPTIAFPTPGEDPTAAPGSLTFNSGSWTSSTTYVATYDVFDWNLAMPSVDVQVSGAKDLVGNTQVSSTLADKYSIDMLDPTVTSVAPNLTTITDAHAGSQTFTLTVVFSEAMDTAQNPTIAFPASGKDPTASPATLTFNSGSWTSGTTYVAKYDVADQNVAMPNVDVRLSGAKDPAGNAQVSSTAAGPFSIDTQNPTVASVTPNLTTITDANAGSQAFTLTVVFSEAMDTTANPAIAFPASGKDPTASPATLTFNSGTWTNSTTYVATYDVADNNVAMPSVDVQVAGAKDPVGNTQVSSTLADKFSIDTQNPTVASVTPNLATISDANPGSQTFRLTVVFSEAMNSTVNPTIAFPTPGEDPTAAPASLTFNSGSWTGSTTYVAKYDVADQNVNMSNVDVRVSGVEDSPGNALVASTTANVFSIDTQNPTVASVTPNLTSIADANVGSQTFTLSVVFSEAMDTTQDPTIAFPASGKDPTAAPATLTFNSGSWTDSTTYVAKYDVADQNVAMPNVDVRLSGAKDPAGNAQVGSTAAGTFSIDTLNPTVTGVTPNLTTITDANAGSQTFTLTVAFSEAMDTAQNPTIAFPASGNDPTAAPATLTFSSATWTSSTTYVATYDVSDQDVAMPNVDVQVSGAKDPVGNAQVSSTVPNSFSIDTLSPVVLSVTPSLATVADAHVGSLAFTLSVVFSDAMDTSVNPTIAFPASGKDPTASPATLSFNSGSWTSGTTFVATYDVADQNLAMPSVDVSISGAKDTLGHAQITLTAAGSFSIDTLNPTVASVTPNLTTITDANVGSQTFTLSLVFSEAMDTAQNPTIGFPASGKDPTASPATLTFDSGAWTNGTTYVAKYNVADQNVAMSAVDVQVSGARDSAQNAQTAFTAPGSFSISTLIPAVVSVTPNLATIADANVGSQAFTLTVVFTGSMNTSLNPTIAFPASGKDPTASPATLTFSSGSWTSGTTFVATYDVADRNVAMPNVDVQVSGAKDPSGNTQLSSTTAASFSIDTQNATVTSINPSLAAITDANVGSQTFTLSLIFSEVMDTTQNPTISFPTTGEDPTAAPATLTFSSGTWTTSSTYVAKYDVADQNVAMPNVDVRVTGAKDPAGNTQFSGAVANKFSIDTQNPTVTSVTPNLASITDANLGSQAFTLTVVFSQAMDTSLNPTIAFPASGKDPTASPATLTFDSGTWTNNSTTYVAKYNVADQNVAMSAVDVRVSGARDPAQNSQTAFTAPGSFSIDTQTPPATSSISGHVYVDSSAAGPHTGHATIPHVTVTLQEQDSGGSWHDWTTNPTQQTDDQGWYSFTGLSAGTYRVVETQPAAFLEGGPNTLTVSLAAGTQQSGIDFTDLGLKPQYISLRLFLASTPPASQMLHTLGTAPVVDLNGPAQSGNNARVHFTPGGAAVAIASPTAQIRDSSSPTLVSLTATITNPLDGSAETLDADVTGTNIAKSYANGVLTLSGVDFLSPVQTGGTTTHTANYQTVLDSIRYDNTSASPTAATDRIISLQAYDGILYSNLAATRVRLTDSSGDQNETNVLDATFAEEGNWL